MSETHIRRVEVNDLEQLSALCVEHAAYERASFASPNASRLHPAIFSARPRLHVWVAARPSELVGYVSATVDFSTWSSREFVHLDCLYVREAYRGHAIGRSLIDAVIAHAAALDIVEVQWQTPDWNVDAQRFYARLGASAANKVRYTLKVDGVRG
jgi:GNAT superfamily N-acetyltransferase